MASGQLTSVPSPFHTVIFGSGQITRSFVTNAFRRPVFALISSRYERSSIVVSSNKSFSAWAEIFGDAVAVVVD
jgi:IstB-like ATP binding protein